MGIPKQRVPLLARHAFPARAAVGLFAPAVPAEGVGPRVPGVMQQMDGPAQTERRPRQLALARSRGQADGEEQPLFAEVLDRGVRGTRAEEGLEEQAHALLDLCDPPAELEPKRNLRVLFSGTTVHGSQSVDADRQHEPLTYYHRTGPLGQVFLLSSESNAKRHIAVVGLGVGSMACYGEPGQHFTFYEIDPAVQRIAGDPRYFTFLQNCRPKIDVVLGDARRSLESSPDRHFGLIVLDAFSSDAVPAHLLTQEALGLYFRKLAANGVLAFHISNRHLELQPVLEDLARVAGLVGLAQHNLSITEAERKMGAAESQWVVMARRLEDLGSLPRDRRWSALSPSPQATAWTDDFSNTLSVVRWR